MDILERPTGFLSSLAAVALKRRLLAMMLDVVFRRLVAVADRLLRVAVGNERLMRRIRKFPLGVVSRGTAMMQRRLLVMLGRLHVVFGAGQNFAHDASKSAGPFS